MSQEILHLRIQKIEWLNIRQIENLSLELSNINGINLIQIQNGYGKTTTLRLLRYVLSGILPQGKEIINSFRYIGQYGGQRDFSEFKVTFLIKQNKLSEYIKYVIILNLNHTDNTASFSTSSSDLGGLKPGWHLPPRAIDKFKGKHKFVNLFVFDGETAEDLNKDSGAELIEESIRQVSNLDLIANLAHTPDNYLMEVYEITLQAYNQSNPNNRYQTIERALKTNKDRMNELNNKILPKLKKEEKKLKQELLKVNDWLNNVGTGDDNYTSQKKELEDQEKQIKGEIKQLTEERYIALFNPGLIFARNDRILKFYEKIERDKIPRTVGKSFLKDLTNSKHCVCGNEWNNSMREHLHTNMESYLGDEVLAYVHSMQTKLAEHTNPITSIDGALEELRQSNRNLKRVQSTLQALKDNYKGVNQEELMNKLQEKSSLNNKIKDIQTEIEEITTVEISKIKGTLDTKLFNYNQNGNPYLLPNNINKAMNLSALKKHRDACILLLGPIKDLRDLYTGINLVQSLISNALGKTLTKLTEEVIKETNTFFSKMHAGGGDHKLASFNEGLGFVDIYGEKLDGVNQAAQLAAAYSFITAMASIGDLSAPLVIDSPAGAFSIGTANNWAAEIPQNFPQVIAFITSSEKVGLLSLLDKNAFTATMIREKEDVNGENRTGKMTINYDESFFTSYEVPTDKMVMK